ncbi:MAG: hypothetical protein QOC81_3179 [Thermoanaerobaculia bacterium]|jgi:hypothetical protein|nr:hypothetical protein [Thermoanaerobaculia bacterium]
MRRVFKGGAVVALIAILMAPALYADDPPGPFDPPQARLGPPTGIASQDEPPTVFELFLVWLQARLGPPTG